MFDIGGLCGVDIGPCGSRWEAVRHSRADAVDGVSTPAEVDLWVNRNIRYQREPIDVWALPRETLGRGFGDCEDFAILKRALLLAAGRADGDIAMVIVNDLIARQPHAVLMVDGLVLDSFNSLHLPVSKVRDYTPIMAFCGERRFTYGRPQG